MAKEKDVPVTVTPQICNPFTANTGDTVVWQNVPPTGCKIEQDGNKPWPFNIGPPINLPSPSTIMVTAGKGTYTINVKCCADHALKSVTVP